MTEALIPGQLPVQSDPPVTLRQAVQNRIDLLKAQVAELEAHLANEAHQAYLDTDYKVHQILGWF